MNPGTLAVVVLSALLLAWYIAGHLYNRRRGLRLRHWLAGGLDALGQEREQGWIGSPASGACLRVRRANPPFRRLEVLLLLANREIPLLWLLDRLRGRQDRIIVRATLRSPRRGEVKIRSCGRTERQNDAWTWQKGPHGLQIAYRDRNAHRLVTALEPWLDTYGTHVIRFDWQKQDPHINVQLKIAGLLGGNVAEMLLSDLGSALNVNRNA